MDTTIQLPEKLPFGFRELKTHELKKQGDLFWTGVSWRPCKIFGEPVGVVNFVVRNDNVKFKSIKERVQKYLKKSKKRA